MKKKLLAFLTAICCMASIAGMTASANHLETNSDIFTEDHITEILDNMMGGIVYHTSSTYPTLLIETDGTVLTEKSVQDLQNFDGFSAVEWGMDEQLTYSNLEIEPGTMVYQLQFSTLKDLPAIARKFHLDHDFVETIHFVRSHSYQNCTLGNGLKFTLADRSYEPNPADFPELTNLKIDTLIIDGVALEGEGNWHGTFTDETMAECHKNHAEGSYESYLFMKKIADRIMEEHSDVFLSVEPTLKSMDYSAMENLAAQSIWDGAGDCNSDGAVNAKDAAEQLIAAANAATGGEIEITSANDVNADGAVNALDAAAVLIYAAAKGSGEAVSWVEILR